VAMLLVLEAAKCSRTACRLLPIYHRWTSATTVTLVIISGLLEFVTVTVTEALVLCPLLEDRGHITESVCPGARRQNETAMFSDHDETSPSIAAVSASLVACSMLAVQQQERLCRQFVDVSAA